LARERINRQQSVIKRQVFGDLPSPASYGRQPAWQVTGLSVATKRWVCATEIQLKLLVPLV